MKKLVMLLAVLIATPVFALTIAMTQNLDGTVTVGYSGADAQNLPRAFALKFTIDKGAYISGISEYKEDGENESGDPQAYGIYPARIIVEPDGTVTPGNYGSPLADPLDPGAGDGSTVVVLELGSLYVDDSNAPGLSGTLCTLTIDCNEAEDPNLTMIDEDVYRGGVLLEDGTPVVVDQTITLVCGPLSPACWDYLTQCHGDSDNTGDVKGSDFNALKQSWYKCYPHALYNPCADFDRGGCVKGSDFNTLKQNWYKSVASDCPPGGTWPPNPPQ